MAEEEITRVEPKNKRGGAWITFGTEAYRVPPLAFASVQELQGRIAAMQGMTGGQPSQDQMDTVVDVVFAAIKRNYPDMPREQIADMLDLQNYQEVLGAVLNIAGFKAATPGEPSGEAPASIGTQSTSP